MKTPEEKRAWRRAYKKRPEIREKLRLANRAYRSKNKHKTHEWYLNCRRNGTHSSVNGKNLQWYYDNAERASRLHKNWTYRNRAHINTYDKKRRDDSPALKIEKTMRRRLSDVMRKLQLRKALNTMTLVGCNRESLAKWLEARFTPGMTWANYGLRGWHVDHIRPCASFDLENPVEQRICFHYSNLQPLWWADNLSKSDSWQQAA